MTAGVDRRGDPFDVDAFLARPLVARVATAATGPAVRPVWYLWEDRSFWWLTGSWSHLPGLLASDPRLALVVDSCDLTSGETRQVSAQGVADVLPFDGDLVYRKLRRYLGSDRDRWDHRFTAYLTGAGADAQLARLRPERLVAHDLSFRPSITAATP